MTLRALFPLLFAAWGLSEVVLVWRRRARSGGRDDVAVRDRGSQWVVIGSVLIAVALAARTQHVAAAAMPWPQDVLLVLATVLLLGGVAVRWHAIRTLGRFFTVNVAVQPEQHVVQAGLYRCIRHPSYTGALLAVLGAGIAFHNWLSLAVLMLPVALALGYRIRVEEAVLIDALGDAYRDYCRRTKRLIPGVY
jgi:protein-S-isoprenylcysteine O-methyltransferase Ste14